MRRATDRRAQHARALAQGLGEYGRPAKPARKTNTDRPRDARGRFRRARR